MYLVFFQFEFCAILCFELGMNALVYVECQHRPRTKSMRILYLRPSIMYLTSVTIFLEENIFIGSLMTVLHYQVQCTYFINLLRNFLRFLKNLFDQLQSIHKPITSYYGA